VSQSCTCTSPPERVGYEDAPCPTNQQIGKRVDSITLKAFIALPLTVLRSVEYRFCRAEDCPTVYYSVDGAQVFQEVDLRETVFQKHMSDANTLVCYCFRHTIGSIGREIEQSGTSTVVAQITVGIQAGHCACDIRNPQGTCCLGNVRRIIRRMMQQTSCPVSEHTEEL
jgi:hypothetical protein